MRPVSHGVATLRQQVTSPPGAASVRVELTGFVASDPTTAGKETYE